MVIPGIVLVFSLSFMVSASWHFSFYRAKFANRCYCFHFSPYYTTLHREAVICSKYKLTPMVNFWVLWVKYLKKNCLSKRCKISGLQKPTSSYIYSYFVKFHWFLYFILTLKILITSGSNSLRQSTMLMPSSESFFGIVFSFKQI